MNEPIALPELDGFSDPRLVPEFDPRLYPRVNGGGAPPPDACERNASLTASIRVLVLAVCLLQPVDRALADDPEFSTDPEDSKACSNQLNRIYGAITEYRKQHGNNPPDKLSDLAGDYLPSRALVCPFVENRGGLRTWKKRFSELSPDSYTSYSYEFPPVLLHHLRWRGVPRKTVRDLKERQAKEVGPVVPIVRCHAHRPWLNLAVGGNIYESETLYWERNFLEDDHILMATHLFGLPPPARQPVAADFPLRPAGADPRLLDLTDHYNAILTNAWQGFPGNHLAALPTGIQRFDGVDFDVRGVIQLRGSKLPINFPAQVSGIRVRQTCARIHFLHAGSIYYKPSNVVASYQVHYADGRVEEFRALAEQHLGDWWRDPRRSAASAGPKAVWTGENEAAKAYGMVLGLYHAQWENPRKDTEITSITLMAGHIDLYAGPFVVAITLE